MNLQELSAIEIEQKDFITKIISSEIDKVSNKMSNKIDKIIKYLGGMEGIDAHSKCDHIPNAITRKSIKNIEKGIGLHIVDSVKEFVKELREELREDE